MSFPELTLRSDTLLIIPTHRHPTCLPLAVNSARRQSVEDLDIVVIGDGVSDDTRDAIAPILADDPRVRFLDLPKGARHGERYRDAVIRQSPATVVSYLGDDDLLLPHHLATMRDLIEGRDFVNPLPIFIQRDGSLFYIPADLGNPDSLAWHLDPDAFNNSVSLTGATHTRESYLRLPFGWRPAPDRIPTDFYMWHQYFHLEGFRAATSRLATTVKFPETTREDMAEPDRAAEIAQVAASMESPGFVEAWNAHVDEIVRFASVKFFLLSLDLERRLSAG